VLVQKIAGAILAMFIESAFGLGRPNRARFASACFADCSRSLRFLNRFRLITSAMFASIIRRLEGMKIDDLSKGLRAMRQQI
jgi:hypothetical protein